MWDLKNRSVIALISALTGCIFIYNIWGPILFLTISLILITYVCYCLIINDNLLSQHAFLLFNYCKQYFLEFIESVIEPTCRYIREFSNATSDRFRQIYLTENQSSMERRRGSQYQLSSDPYPIRRNSSGFGSIAQLSPITKNSQNIAVLENINNPRDNFYRNLGHSYDQNSFVTHKHTSTPKFPVGEEEVENQTFKVSPDNRRLSKRVSPTYRENGATFLEENPLHFAGDSTPSGFHTSSRVLHKLHNKMIEQKPVSAAQIGPLSMSTRYNIDPKICNDISSPGLTTRLTKYATEANNKLTHQSRYHVGQFPKVNLNASPVPVINAKSMKTRTPVTVRIAPPDAVCYSPPLKQHILTDVYSSENSCSSSNVHTLRDISLKRHASGDDVASDLPKKLRTGSFGRDQIEIHDETTQKRSRDDSTKSDEDTSPQSQTTRPAKRTKTPSCYDIINSLSSSKHVVSGVKRKARDFSRSGTPDFEKHFKSLECVQSAGTQTSAEFPIEISPVSSRNNYQISEKEKDRNACNLVCNKSQNNSPLKGILKSSNTIAKGDKQINRKHSNLQSSEKDGPVEPTSSEQVTESTKLTHKLFMRAEPERNEKLRMLVEEQGNIRAKFTTDDVEEIKREDIADMRQTSMKARLQSMFDAISGRATSRINPDVVIQAEEVNVVEPVACPVTCATLNSSTTTTNINTTPISTSAVVLGPGTTESITKSPKHVSFDLPNKETSSNAKNVSFSNTVERKIDSVQTSSITDTKSNVDSQVTSTVSSTSISSSINSNVPQFNFNKPKSSLIKPATSGVLPVTVNNSPTSVAPPVTTSIFTRNVLASTPISSSVSTTPTTTNAKIIASESKPKTNVSSQVSQASPAIVNSTTVKEKERNIASPIISLPSTVSTAISTSSSSVNLPAPLFTFGDKTRTDPPPTTFKPAEGFTFNSSGNMSLSSGTFGASTASRQTTINNNVTTTNTNNSIANTAPNTGFESTPKTTTKTTASTFGQSTNPPFTFRSASTMPTTSTSDKAGFSFGNVTNATIGNSNTGLFTMGNNSSPSFGVPTTTSSNVIQFTPSSGSSIFASSPSTTSSTPSIFGAVTSNQQPIFGTPSSLNTTTATFALPKSTVTPVFGSSMTTTASSGFASTNSLPIFSNTGNASSTPSTISLPTFGSTAVTSTSEINSNMFSVSNPTTTTSNIFDQASSGTSFRSGSGAFGSSNSMLFGSQVTTTSTFGSTNNSTISGSGFGTTSASSSSGPIASGFMSQNQNKEGVQSSGTQSFGGGNSIFGGDNVAPAFGTSNSGVSFDSSATHNSQTPTFGTVAGPSTSGPANFGDTNKILPFGAQSSAFGASPASTPAFGNASTNNENNTSGIFTFGANQKSSTQQNSFSFGANSNTATTCASSSFQFGSTMTNTNSAPGFNFSAPSTTPSINFGASSSTATFNATGPGMFSIGSGSTAPRSRNTRNRKLR